MQEKFENFSATETLHNPNNMKKKISLTTFAIVSLVVIGSLVSYGAIETTDLKAEQSLPRTVKTTEKKNSAKLPQRVSDVENTWIVKVQSNFNDDTSFTYSDGPVYEYGAEVILNGNKAKIKGLFNLWFDDVDSTYDLEGEYNQRTGEITIPVTEYDSDKKGLDGYVRVAEMYSFTSNQPYTLVLFSGDMTTTGDLTTKKGLVFTVSDDMDLITAKNGFGLYAFDANGNEMGFYDYYKTCSMTKPVDGVALSVNPSELDFAGRYICQGLEQNATVTLLNKGKETSEIAITTTTPDLRTNIKNLSLSCGESKTIEINMIPSSVGILDEYIVFTPQNGSEVKVHTGVEVHPRPDYTLITKNGKEYMEFNMSPIYPFVIDEIENNQVAISTNGGESSEKQTESWFTITLEIPQGKTGLFSFKGMQVNRQPNGFAWNLDGQIVESFMNSNSYDPAPIDGVTVIPSGKHVLGFSNLLYADWFEFTGIIPYSYIYDLDLQLFDSSDSLVYLVDDEIVFEDAWFDSLTTSRDASVRLYNLGNSILEVKSVVGENGFSGSVPSQKAAKGGFIDVPLKWTVDKVGTTTGIVKITTNAGEFEVECTGSAQAIPEEYHNIVSKGDFSFDTDSKYPFAYNSVRGYLYNSSSKTEKDEIIYSWLDASFEVPEGSVGKITWEATNDSEDLFYYLNQVSVISGTIFTIDGQAERNIGGQGVDCSSSTIYTPGELIFKPGRHTIRFNYKKTSSQEKFVFGDDRIKLYEIGLELINAGDIAGYVTPEFCNFKDIQYSVGRDGHQTVGIVSMDGSPVKLVSWESEGPFSVVDLSEHFYEGTTPFMVEYHPTKTGKETGKVTLHTNIGDYTVDCQANGIDLNRGERVFYESFEYGADNWLFEDFDQDGMSWIQMADLIDNYVPESYVLFGYQAMGSIYYDYGGQNKWFESKIDNVMFSPEIEIPSEGKSLLQFMVQAKIYSGDTLEVLVAEDADTYIDLYEKIWDQGFNDDTQWTEYMIDITKYAGKKVRFAFRTSTPNAYNAYYIMIDDVLVTNTEGAGVNEISDTERNIESIEYYSVDGKRLNKPSEELTIVVTKWSDGSVSTQKIVGKTRF